jgi:hypothetical protein
MFTTNNVAVAVNQTTTFSGPKFVYLVVSENYLSEETRQSRFVSLGKCCILDAGVAELLRLNGNCFAP